MSGILARLAISSSSSSSAVAIRAAGGAASASARAGLHLGSGLCSGAAGLNAGRRLAWVGGFAGKGARNGAMPFSSSSSIVPGQVEEDGVKTYRVRYIKKNPEAPSNSRKARAKLVKKIEDICGEQNVADIARDNFLYIDRAISSHLKKHGGRNNHGRLTAFRKGGGFKRRYRHIDFKRNTPGKAEIITLNTHDPVRTAPIALARWLGEDKRNLPIDEQFFYMLAPEGLKIGDIVENRMTGDEAEDGEIEMKVGTSAPLREFPIGSVIHNVEITQGKGGQLCRAAATSARILGHADRKGQAAMPHRAPLGQPGHSAHWMQGDPRRASAVPQDQRKARRLRIGGKKAQARMEAYRPRRCDEPCRSSPRRRKR